MPEKYKMSIKDIDKKIEDYVNETVIPLLLPFDATDSERLKMKDILIPIVSLDIYKKNLDDLYSESNIHNKKAFSTAKMEKMIEYYLTRTSPKVDKNTYALKGISASRYGIVDAFGNADRQYNNFTIKGQLLRYRIENYIYELKKELTPKQIRELVKQYPHVSRVEDIREVMHNGGSMNNLGKENVFYRGGQEKVRLLRSVLKRKIEECNKNPNGGENAFSQKEMILLQLDYLKAKMDFNLSFSISKYAMYSQNTRELQKMQEEKEEAVRIEEEEKLKIQLEKAQMKRAITLFDSCFPYFPMEEAEHDEFLKKINNNVFNEIFKGENITRKQRIDFRRKLKARYDELMEQYKNGTLPRELSFDPVVRKEVEDEKKEAKIERKKEEIEKSKQELKKSADGFFIGAAILITASILLFTVEGRAEGFEKEDDNSNLNKDEIGEKDTNKETPLINSDFNETQEIVILSNLLYKNGIEEEMKKIIEDTEKCKESIIKECEEKVELPVASIRRRRNRIAKIEKENSEER